MSKINPIRFKSKSGKSIAIRSAEPADAATLLRLGKSVMAEDGYTLTTPEEFSLTVEEEVKWIEEINAHPSKLVVVAVLDSQVIGSLDFSPGHRKRIAHTGEFGMSISHDHREDGIGYQLLRVLLDWACTHAEIEKIYLKVHATNERAIRLYQKCGFLEEGRFAKDLKLGDDSYADTVVMSRFV